MAKKILKAVCETVNLQRNGSLVRFAVGSAEIKDPAVKAQNPNARAADVVINVAFKSAEDAAAYAPGKSYSITIE